MGAVGQAWASPPALHPVDRSPCSCFLVWKVPVDLCSVSLVVVEQGGHGVVSVHGLRTALDPSRTNVYVSILFVSCILLSQLFVVE